MKNPTTWKWAISTPEGVYNGEFIGLMEPGETNEHAMQTVSDIVKDYLTTEHSVSKILACFVTDGQLHIDAPNTELIPLNIEKDFTH